MSIRPIVLDISGGTDTQRLCVLLCTSRNPFTNGLVFYRVINFSYCEVSIAHSCEKQYVYHVNVSKTWLIIKKEFKSQAEAVFGETKVKVISEGHPHLGAPPGSPNYASQYVPDKTQKWCRELKLLSKIAIMQPHAPYAAYTHGLTSKWRYLTRTSTLTSSHLKALMTF